MKINYVALYCLAFLAAAFAFCTKSDPQPLEESPFFTFFDQPAITIDTTPVAATTWEYGFIFNPLKDGKVTQLGLKLPVTGAFHVKLWDLTGASPQIRSDQTVTSASSHTPAFVAISPVAVRKDAQWGVTVVANSFYRIQKKDASAFNFPQVVDNIRIVSFNETMSGMSQDSFPQTANLKRVAPCVNVVFVAD